MTVDLSHKSLAVIEPLSNEAFSLMPRAEVLVPGVLILTALTVAMCRSRSSSAKIMRTNKNLAKLSESLLSAIDCSVLARQVDINRATKSTFFPQSLRQVVQFLASGRINLKAEGVLDYLNKARYEEFLALKGQISPNEEQLIILENDIVAEIREQALSS